MGQLAIVTFSVIGLIFILRLYAWLFKRPDLVKSEKFSSYDKSEVLDVFAQQILKILTKKEGKLEKMPTLVAVSDDLFQTITHEVSRNPYYETPTKLAIVEQRGGLTEMMDLEKLKIVAALESVNRPAVHDSTTSSPLQNR